MGLATYPGITKAEFPREAGGCASIGNNDDGSGVFTCTGRAAAFGLIAVRTFRGPAGQGDGLRRMIIVASIALGCAGCALPQPAEPELSQVMTSVAPDDPNCIEYSAQVVGQTARAIIGRACRQADGSWKVTEGSPGQPVPSVLVYWPPPDAYAGLYDPWFWGPPIGFSVGAVVFVDRDHHIHRFRDVAEFAHRLQHHSFGHSEPGFGMHHG